MAKQQPLSYVLYIKMDDGSVVELDQLMPEQREQWLANVRRRLSMTMSGYYTQHPEEYEKIKGVDALDNQEAGGAVQSVERAAAL